MSEAVSWLDMLTSAGTLLGGFGACWAAHTSLRTLRKTSADRESDRLEAKKAEQARAKEAAAANYDEATNQLIQYREEFISRARSLKRQHKRAGSPQTVTDIALLTDELKEELNKLGERFNNEKAAVFNVPVVVVSDWVIEEIKSRDIIGQARNQISAARHKLNEFADDLEDTLASRE